nr:MAG TPA: hypothetical protein [Caudoviricetes sp.]
MILSIIKFSFKFKLSTIKFVLLKVYCTFAL